MFAKRISRSLAVPFLSRIPVPQQPSHKSHGINLFADPHPLTPVASIFYKNIGGWEYSLSPKSFPCHTSENSPVSPTIATDPKTHVSNPSICHTSETPPGGSTHFDQSTCSAFSCRATKANSSRSLFPILSPIPYPLPLPVPPIPFLFRFFRTPLHNGHLVSAFHSITCALISLRRGCIGACSLRILCPRRHSVPVGTVKRPRICLLLYILTSLPLSFSHEREF